MYCSADSGVEACPYDALFMGNSFERASYTRPEMVIDVDELRTAAKQPSAFFRPNLDSVHYVEGFSLPSDDAGRPWAGRRWAERGKPTPQAPEEKD